MKRLSQPTACVVFGATGDLTQRKLYPSLYELARRNLLPPRFYIYGLARQKMTSAQFKSTIRKELKEFVPGKLDKKVVDRLLSRVEYIAADITERAGFQELEDQIQAEEKKIGKGILRLFYLALPPILFPHVAKNVESCRMGKALCTRDHILSRIIVEKPFGYSLSDAQKLDKQLHEAFNEQQIYRIDHYLGKEPMQNILMFRFANQLFEDSWNRDHIKQIQINALETVGLEKRFSYYDGAGAIRDMVQNHLLQFLAYVTMDEPKIMNASELQKAKYNVLKMVRPFGGKTQMVRGQYKGYKSEEGIPSSSKTETYVALKLEINSPRWRGVPIYIRTGKHLGRKETSAVIEFNDRDCCLISDPKFPRKPNLVSLNIAPVPSVSVQVNMHRSGTHYGADQASMHYCRSEWLSSKPLGDYERLLVDVISGDQLLFTSSKEVMAQWTAVTPFLKAAKRSKPEIYKSGSMGPKKVEDFVGRDGNEWISPIVSCPLEK